MDGIVSNLDEKIMKKMKNLKVYLNDNAIEKKIRRYFQKNFMDGGLYDINNVILPIT